MESITIAAEQRKDVQEAGQDARTVCRCYPVGAIEGDSRTGGAIDDAGTADFGLLDTVPEA
ncbi:MAG: hypothetical protein M3305_10615 [Actinomycetota bacterium]|nr:hypothetical protein [Actinomycetota bacterium]